MLWTFSKPLETIEEDVLQKARRTLEVGKKIFYTVMEGGLAMMIANSENLKVSDEITKAISTMKDRSTFNSMIAKWAKDGPPCVR